MVSSTPWPYPPGKDPVPILQVAGWAPGQLWTVGKSRPNGIRFPDRPAHSQSLYRLIYTAHNLVMTCMFYFNIIDADWGRTWSRLNIPVATNVKPAFIQKFCHSWTELDQLSKRLLSSYTLDNEKVRSRTNISWQTFFIILGAPYL